MEANFFLNMVLTISRPIPLMCSWQPEQQEFHSADKPVSNEWGFVNPILTLHFPWSEQGED
jgi:hypothetical protein